LTSSLLPPLNRFLKAGLLLGSHILLKGLHAFRGKPVPGTAPPGKLAPHLVHLRLLFRCQHPGNLLMLLLPPSAEVAALRLIRAHDIGDALGLLFTQAQLLPHLFGSLPGQYLILAFRMRFKLRGARWPGFLHPGIDEITDEQKEVEGPQAGQHIFHSRLRDPWHTLDPFLFSPSSLYS
jgi:hypothetical protein